MTYQITIDKDACDGIFACLVRDDRFVEDDDGIATLDGDVTDEDGLIVGEFETDIDAARGAAAACPPDAITVTEVAATEETALSEKGSNTGDQQSPEVSECR